MAGSRRRLKPAEHVGCGDAVLRVTLRPVRKRMIALIREAVTEHMMTLSIAGRLLSLSDPVPLPPSPLLGTLSNPDLVALLATVPPPVGAMSDVGARDWSSVDQRMRYISYLFRAWHQRPEVFEAPFQTAQLMAISEGVVPDGRL